MKGFHYSVFQLCDPLLPVAAQGHLVVVEPVGRQRQKTVQGLSQETQRGNETATPSASVLGELETKDRMPLKNDPSVGLSPPSSSLCPVPDVLSASCQPGRNSARVGFALRGQWSINTCSPVT